MSSNIATPSTRLQMIIIAAAVVVTAALVGVLGHPCAAVLPPSAAGSTAGEPTGRRQLAPPRREPRTSSDDVAPNGTTVFDDAVPAVVRLEPELRRALRRAATAAAGEGVEFRVTSGWRSREHQERLFREAVAKYGSPEAAARWVATPGTSPHEKGAAVDLGRADATSWLAEHGAAYGLCQTYRNEPWHYELRAAAVDRGCPAPYADPTQDPRMRR